jgi:hypothetical protein
MHTSFIHIPLLVGFYSIITTELDLCMKLLLATSEVFNAMTFHTAAFWVLTPHSLEGGKQNFRLTVPPTSGLNPAKFIK